MNIITIKVEHTEEWWIFRTDMFFHSVSSKSFKEGLDVVSDHIERYLKFSLTKKMEYT